MIAPAFVVLLMKSQDMSNKGARLAFSMPSDLMRYRSRYGGKIADDPTLNDNIKFYQGEIASQPHGDFVDNIHKYWATDYERLEQHHGYIQWLFPIHEEGLNDEAQVLQRHEAEVMQQSTEIMLRVMVSYKLILGFYGVTLENAESGQLRRAPNFKERYSNLNRKSHNYLRITRVLKFLGEVGLERLKLAFLTFFISEVVSNGLIPNCRSSLENYWIFTLRHDEDLAACLRYLRRPASPPPTSVLLHPAGGPPAAPAGSGVGPAAESPSAARGGESAHLAHPAAADSEWPGPHAHPAVGEEEASGGAAGAAGPGPGGDAVSASGYLSAKRLGPGGGPGPGAGGGGRGGRTARKAKSRDGKCSTQ